MKRMKNMLPTITRRFVSLPFSTDTLAATHKAFRDDLNEDTWAWLLTMLS